MKNGVKMKIMQVDRISKRLNSRVERSLSAEWHTYCNRAFSKSEMLRMHFFIVWTLGLNRWFLSPSNLPRHIFPWVLSSRWWVHRTIRSYYISDSRQTLCPWFLRAIFFPFLDGKKEKDTVFFSKDRCSWHSSNIYLFPPKLCCGKDVVCKMLSCICMHLSF